MRVKFRTYCGLAGDSQELLIAEGENGIRVSRLYNRVFFKNWNMARAKKKLVKEIEIITGKKVIT